MDKDKAIFFGIIGSVVILLIIYISFSFGGKKDNEKEDVFLAPDIETKKHQYESRIDAITKGRYESDEKENQLRYNFIDDKENKQEEETGKKAEVKRKRVAVQKKSINQSTNKSSDQKEENFQIVQKQENESSVDVRYSFSSSSQEKNSSGNGSTMSRKDNVWAQLDDKTIIKQNSHQVFLLEKGTAINGRHFPGNSKLYTKSIIKKDYVDIIVNRIKDINTGDEYSIEMFAVNEDRSRGIKYKGKVNKETDKASKSVVGEAMQSVYRRYDVDEVAEAAGDGLEEIAGRENIEISLGKGYRLIFVQNTQ